MDLTLQDCFGRGIDVVVVDVVDETGLDFLMMMMMRPLNNDGW